MAKKRGPDTFISRLFTRHEGLRRIEGRRASEMARVMKDVKKKALGLIERNMTTFREAGEYIDSAAAVARANQTVAGIDALMAQRADWATSEVLSMRQEAWKQGVSDIEFAAERLPGGVQAQMQASFGQAFPEAAFSAVEHPVLGVAPDAMFNGMRAGTTQGMRNILVNAVVSGESVQDTGRAISDALDLSVAAGERIARTNVNAMYNEAQKSVYDANADILAGYAWEATLDDRTSQVCFMLHGQFWPLGSKTPGPPAHWNCRSILVPVFKDPAVQALLDDTPRRARQYTKTGKMRDIMVKGTTTPEQWARRQPAEISLRVTGSKLKNSLFRRKLIGFDDLVDPSLRVRTDQEIIKRVAALHPGNKALQKQARAMGIKTIPSPASVRKADAALAKKQPWRAPEPVPTAPKVTPERIPSKPIPPPAGAKVGKVGSPAHKEWVQSLSQEEERALGAWRASARNVRKYQQLGPSGLRKELAGLPKKVQDSIIARYRAQTMELDRALRRAPRAPGTVWRGLSNVDDAAFNRMLKDEVIDFDAISSTSKLKQRAEVAAVGRKNVFMRIEQSSGIDLGDFSAPGEREVLLRKGTRFRVVERRVIRQRGGERLEITLREIKAVSKPSPVAKPKPTPRKSYVDRGGSASYKAEWKKWEKGLSSEERRAIEAWTDNRSNTVQRVRLREIGVVKGRDIKPIMDDLHSALDRAPSRGGTVYRGLSLSKNEYEQLREIKTLRLRSSASSSRTEGIARDFTAGGGPRAKQVVLELKTRSSVDFSGIDPWGGGEKEQIIRMGTQFRITGTKRRGDFFYLFGEEI